MTAYLDSINIITPKAKKILMVFYDITDISLDEIGMSERVWEGIEGLRRRQGHSGRLERLSDLLGWLASRDFSITLCVDTNRTKEYRVRNLLQRLKEIDPEAKHIKLLMKSILDGSMHIKGMVTPIGAIDGSANLTRSGVRKNDESVNHANVGTQDYSSIKMRLEDALGHGCIEWTE
jgi:hypothetical protein